MLSEGVTNVSLVSFAVPPVATSHQRYCPFVAPVAVKVTLPGPQLDFGVAVGAVGMVSTDPATAVRVLSQVPLLMLT